MRSRDPSSASAAITRETESSGSSPSVALLPTGSSRASRSSGVSRSFRPSGASRASGASGASEAAGPSAASAASAAATDTPSRGPSNYDPVEADGGPSRGIDKPRYILAIFFAAAFFVSAICFYLSLRSTFHWAGLNMWTFFGIELAVCITSLYFCIYSVVAVAATLARWNLVTRWVLMVSMLNLILSIGLGGASLAVIATGETQRLIEKDLYTGLNTWTDQIALTFDSIQEAHACCGSTGQADYMASLTKAATVLSNNKPRSCHVYTRGCIEPLANIMLTTRATLLATSIAWIMVFVLSRFNRPDSQPLSTRTLVASTQSALPLYSSMNNYSTSSSPSRRPSRFAQDAPDKSVSSGSRPSGHSGASRPSSMNSSSNRSVSHSSRRK